MQGNGSDFGAYLRQLDEELAGVTALQYFTEPVPVSLDLHLDTVIERYRRSSTSRRVEFQTGLSPHGRALFGIYGHRAATRAVNENNGDLLRNGLLASTVANAEIPAGRRIDIGLAVYYHVARKLGLNTADLFTVAADYAGPDLALAMVAFGNRPDFALKQLGWEEQHTPQGINYKYRWR